MCGLAPRWATCRFASVALDARSIYVASGAQVVELDDAGRVVRTLQAYGRLRAVGPMQPLMAGLDDSR